MNDQSAKKPVTRTVKGATQGITVRATDLTDRDALLESVLEHPQDATARLVLADRLRELDNPSEQALGRFIWGSVMVAQMIDPFGSISFSAGLRQATRDLKLLKEGKKEMAAGVQAGYPVQWLAELGLARRPHRATDWIHELRNHQMFFRLYKSGGTFVSGMLTELALTSTLWCRIAAIVLARWPIERVVLGDMSRPTEERPDVTFLISRSKGKSQAWSASARFKIVGVRRSIRVSRQYRDRKTMVARMKTDVVEMMEFLRQQIAAEWPGQPTDW